MILLSGAALGSTAVATRIALEEMSPIAMVGARLVIATAIFAGALAAGRVGLPRTARAWLDLALLGAISVVPLVLFTYALRWISAGVLTLFLALIPALTAAYAHVWLAHERMTGRRAAGLALALVGVAVIVLTRTTGLSEPGGVPPSTDGLSPAADVQSSLSQSSLQGQVLALVGALIAAIGPVVTRLRFPTTPAAVVAGGQTAFGLALVVPLWIGEGGLSPASLTWAGWSALLWSAVFGSVAAFWLMVLITQRYGATAASLPGYVMPVVSAVLGAALLQEQVTVPHLFSAAGILAGVALAGEA